MKKSIMYILSTLLILVLSIGITFISIVSYPTNTFYDSYQSLIQDKYKTLIKTNEPKIIMISGSSSAFGLNQGILEQETGYKVANLGLHAGFGCLFETEIAKANINKGDIVLLGYEYNWFSESSFNEFGTDLIMSGIDSNLEMYKYVPIKNIPSVLGYLFTFAKKKITHTKATGIYSREAFDKTTSQMTWPRYSAMSDYQDNKDLYSSITVVDSDGKVSISKDSIEYLKKFKLYVENQGASIYFVSSPILYESITCLTDDFYDLVDLEEKEIGIPYISDPKLYMFSEGEMFNAINHMNSYGELLRTQYLINDLRECGAVKTSKITDTLKNMSGESFSLTDELPKLMLHKPNRIFNVYRYEANGNIVEYVEGKDYIIDYNKGTIRRTMCSTIPNYSDHDVVYTEGKFSLDSNSNTYNPESNYNYQIMVNYDYFAQEGEFDAIDNKSDYLSQTLKNKISDGDNISICLFDDNKYDSSNINSKGSFLSVIADTLTKLFGCKVSTKQATLDESSKTSLLDNLENIIDSDPDLVLIDWGTIEHSKDNATEDAVINNFKDNIEYSISTLHDAGIDVIIIGFFQQNATWEMENVAATKLYNDTLQSIAEGKNVYFADVYKIFYQIGLSKNLYEDVTIDYIRNPNEWGYKLYLTSILPVFNVSGDILPIDIESYIFIDK